MLLLMLTIIGVTSMNNVSLEERMAGNLRDSDLAFQASEAGLRDGEGWLSSLLEKPKECSSAPCDVWKNGLLSVVQDRDYSWWAANGRDYAGTASNDLSGVYQDPKFIVEYQTIIHDDLGRGHRYVVPGRDYYLITSRAEGGSENALSVLQSSFVKRFN